MAITNKHIKPDSFGNNDKEKNTWHDHFINRVEYQLEKRSGNEIYTKSKLLKDVNETIANSSLLDHSYSLTGSAFSQYTCTNSPNLRTPNVDCVIALSETLGVSVDYLLGIDSAETREKTDIQAVTGLNSNSIDILATNSSVRNFINYALSSSLLDTFCEKIHNLLFSEMFCRGNMSAYSDELKDIINDVISKYNNNEFAFTKNEENFKKILTDALPLTSLSPLKDYLDNNLSYDGRYQIYCQLGNNPSEELLYNMFIDDTVMRIYDIAQYKGKEDYYYAILSNVFISIVKDYASQKREIENLSKKRNGAD